MNRYFLSFIITVLIYLSLIISFLYYNTLQPIKIKTKKSIESVKFTVIKQEKIEPKPIIKPKTTPPPPIVEKIKPKPIKNIKPIIKKDENKTIEKPKPIINPKIVKKIKPKKSKKIIKRRVKKGNKTIKKTQIRKSKSTSKKGVISKIKSNQKAQERSYYSKITKAINKNKSYPSKAKKRNIEGDVKVKVTLSKDGRLISYTILNGNRVFKKSIKKAIKKSFPIKPPKGVFHSNISFSFTLRYKLY